MLFYNYSIFILIYLIIILILLILILTFISSNIILIENRKEMNAWKRLSAAVPCAGMTWPSQGSNVTPAIPSLKIISDSANLIIFQTKICTLQRPLSAAGEISKRLRRRSAYPIPRSGPNWTQWSKNSVMNQLPMNSRFKKKKFWKRWKTEK